MFRCNISASELYESFPRLKEWIKFENLQTIINSSALAVVEDLRRKQIDASKLYIPLPITTDGVSLGNERRVIIDVSDVGSGLSFTIHGSDDGTTYSIVRNVDGSDMVVGINQPSRTSLRMGELYSYIKYTVTGTGTYSVFAVDTSFDQLVIYKTLINICLPIMGTSDDARSMYEQTTQMYDITLANKYDYDRDSSGSIDSSERNVNRMIRMMR